MAHFRYRAATRTGSIASGTVEGVSLTEGMARVRQLGLAPIEVAEVKAAASTAAAARGRVAPAGIARAVAELAILLQAGLPIDRALGFITDNLEAPGERAAFAALHRQVKEGVPLSQAMAAQPAVFPPMAPAMAEAGEASGALGATLARLGDALDALADAIDRAGGIGVPIYVSSLREADAELLDHLAGYDALVTTVLAAGGSRPASAGAGEDDESWDVQALAALDVPIVQGLCLTWSREQWAASDDGMTPLDVATQVAVPEFDGRLITVAFSFKEMDEQGLPRYVADPERAERVARIAVNHARLRSTPPQERKIAVVLSAYPTKHSRLGNAVGLDTPVSTIRLLRAMREAGYDLGDGFVGMDPLPPVEGEAPDTTSGNALIHELIAAGGQDEEWLTQEQVEGAQVRIPAARYREWFDALPADLREAMTEHWGEAPGEVFVDTTTDAQGEIVTAALVLAGIALTFLLVTVGVAAFQFFSANRPVRVARHQSIPTYYRQLAFS